MATSDFVVKNGLIVNDDATFNGTILSTGSTTFSLLDTNATTITAFSNASTIGIGAVGSTITLESNTLDSTQATFNLLNTPATINAFTSGTAISIGRLDGTGTTTVNNNFTIGGNNLTVSNDLTVNGETILLGSATSTTTIGNNLVVVGDLTTPTGTFNLLNTTATTVNAFGAATALDIGATTGVTSINNALDVDLDLNVDGGDITTNSASFNLLNTTATTVNAFGAATTLTLGQTTGTTTIRNNLTVDGNLTISGTTTTLNTTTLDVQDTNITINAGAGDTSASANGAGITIQDAVNATTNATMLWDATADNFVFSHRVEAPTLESTVASGTAPLVVASNTLVTNLNADLLDGLDSAAFLLSGGTDNYTSGTLTFDSGTTVNVANGANFNFDRATGVSPFTVDSTTVVTNLNADLLDGLQGTSYLLSGATDNYTSGTLTFDSGTTVNVANGSNFNFDRATGVSPFTVASTTLVANLNANFLSGLQSSQFLLSGGTDNYTSGTLTFDSGTTVNIANGAAFNFDRATGISPFTVDSTTKVVNLNVERLDDLDSTQFLRSDADDTFTNLTGTSVTVDSITTGTLNIGTPWIYRTTAYSAAVGDQILADTTGGSFTVTLPAAPAAGASVLFADGGDWSANSLTVARNGNTIEGSATDLIIDLIGIQVEVIFDGTTWEVFALTNASSTQIGDDNTSNITVYPQWVEQTSGLLIDSKVSSTKLTYNPSTGVFASIDFNSTSDARLKDNITTIENAGELIDKIHAVSFNWKDTGRKANGVIAQEIEKILPEIVGENTDTGMKSVSYTQLVPYLISAVQELREEIRVLKGK